MEDKEITRVRAIVVLAADDLVFKNHKIGPGPATEEVCFRLARLVDKGMWVDDRLCLFVPFGASMSSSCNYLTMLSSMVVELTFEGIHEDLIVQLPGTKPSLKGELQTLSIYFGDKKGEWELDEVVFVGKWPELFRVRAIWWWYHLVNMPRRVKTKYIDV